MCLLLYFCTKKYMKPVIHKLIFPLIFIVFVCILFGRVLDFDFLNWDDNFHILNNPDILVLNFSNLNKIFTSFYVGMYQPITTLMFAFEYSLFGFNPKYFHLVSLLFHLANVVLVFYFVKNLKFNKFFAFSIALVFGVHALQVEPISWLSARSTLVYSFFFLLASICYLKFLLFDSRKFLLLSTVFFVLSVLSKPSAISFVFLIPVFHYYFSSKLKTLSYLNLFFVLSLSLFVTILTIYSRPDVNVADAIYTFNVFQNFIFVLWSICLYVFNFLFPTNLTPWVSYPEYLSWYMYIVPLLFACLLFAVYKFSKQKFKVLLSYFLFFIPLSVHLKFIPFGGQFVADRYMYLSVIGFSILIFQIVYGFFESKFDLRHYFYKVIFLVVVLVFNFIYSSSYLSTWKNSETLWTRVIDKEPTQTLGYYNRGVFYRNKGRMLESITDFSKAISLNPTYLEAIFARGGVYNSIGEFRKAENDFTSVLNIDPDFQKSYFNRANSRYSLEQFVLAMKDYKMYLTFVEDHQESEFKIILCMIELGYSLEELQTALRVFVEKYETNAEANYLLGLTFLDNDLIQACKFLKKASELKHHDARRLSAKFCF